MSPLNLTDEEKKEIREKHQAAAQKDRERREAEKNGLKAPKEPKPVEEKK